MDYQDINAKTIDGWIKDGWEWGIPVSHETFEAAKNGDWDIHITPTKNVPHEWVGDVKDKRILGLASGGGQQMPILAARGACCTVLDYSDSQIKSERMVAKREKYSIEIIKGDMTKPLPFADGTFDMIIHPVSNCYARDVRAIWRECYRVLKPGGVLIAGMDNGVNFMFDSDETYVVNHFPFDPLSDPGQMKQLERSEGGVQFSHTFEEQIGGQLEAGFTITAVYEDTNRDGSLYELNVPCFWATRAEKK